jgi:hypothetical protein
MTRTETSSMSSRVIDFAGAPPPSEVALTTPMADFEPTFRALWKSEPVVCRSSGKVWEGLPAPTTAILDVRVGSCFDQCLNTYGAFSHLPHGPSRPCARSRGMHATLLHGSVAERQLFRSS